MTQVDRLRWLSVGLLVGLISAGIATLILGWLHEGAYPYGTFLFYPPARFSDFFLTYHLYSSSTHSAYLSPFANYFPFTALVTLALKPLGGVTAYFVLVFLFALYLLSFALYALRRTLVQLQPAERLLVILLLCFSSFPVIFCFDRGNIEMLLFMFLSLGVMLFLEERYVLSALFLSGGVALKLYPAVFWLLFLKRKQYKACLVSILSFGALSLFGLWVMPGHMVNNIHNFFYIGLLKPLSTGLGMGGTDFSISLLAFFKLAYVMMHSIAGSVVMMEHLAALTLTLSWVYLVLSGVILILVSLYILKYEEAYWKQSMLLVSLMLLIPQVSFDYKMISLLLPLTLFLAKPEQERFDVFYLVLFILLLIPKHYWLMPVLIFRTHFPPVLFVLQVSVVINVLLLLLFMGFIVFDRLSASQLERYST